MSSLGEFFHLLFQNYDETNISKPPKATNIYSPELMYICPQYETPCKMVVEGIIPLMENSIPAGGNKSPEIKEHYQK